MKNYTPHEVPWSSCILWYFLVGNYFQFKYISQSFTLWFWKPFLEDVTSKFIGQKQHFYTQFEIFLKNMSNKVLRYLGEPFTYKLCPKSLKLRPLNFKNTQNSNHKNISGRNEKILWNRLESLCYVYAKDLISRLGKVFYLKIDMVRCQNLLWQNLLFQNRPGQNFLNYFNAKTH